MSDSSITTIANDNEQLLDEVYVLLQKMMIGRNKVKNATGELITVEDRLKRMIAKTREGNLDEQQSDPA